MFSQDAQAGSILRIPQTNRVIKRRAANQQTPSTECVIPCQNRAIRTPRNRVNFFVMFFEIKERFRARTVESPNLSSHEERKRRKMRTLAVLSSEHDARNRPVGSLQDEQDTESGKEKDEWVWAREPTNGIDFRSVR